MSAENDKCAQCERRSVSFINGPTVDYLMVERTVDQTVREMLDLSPGTRGLERKARSSQPLGF